MTDFHARPHHLPQLAAFLAAGVSGARARLEEFYLVMADGGEASFAFGSKMAAVNAVLDTIDSGSRVLVWADPMAPVSRHFDTIRTRTTGVTFDPVDLSDPNQLSTLVCDNSRLLWLEPPIGLQRRIPNLQALIDCARGHDLRIIVDNTAAGLSCYQPLGLGADMMLLGGDEAAPVAVVTANQPYLMFARERLRFFRDHGGAGAADAAAYGTLQALVDAGLRAAQKSATATALATALASHPAVRRVDYPGLPSHPDHHLLQRDWQAADGKLTVLLDRDLAATTAVVAHFQAAGLVTAAAPGFLTQIDHLAAGRQQIPAPVRAEMGLDDSLLVITVGLEPAAQICAAVDRALAAE